MGLSALIVLILFFVLCQLLLPALATERLRAALSANGSGVRVSISAFPAAELLLDRADSVTVHLNSMSVAHRGSGSLSRLLDRVSHANQLEATVGTLWSHGLELRDLTLVKRGAALTLRAKVTQQAVQRALPSFVHVSGSPKPGGGLSLAIVATLLGKSVTAHAAVLARDGDVEISPTLPLLSGFELKLFSDSHVAAESVSLIAAGGLYQVTARGRYR